MNDQDLRALIREVVARRLGERPASSPSPRLETGAGHGAAPDAGCQDHPSHALFVALVNVGDACLIEPAVTCNHCGYCKSQGH